MVRFRCPSCQKRLKATDDEYACCSCGALLKIPRPGDPRPVRLVNQGEPSSTVLRSCLRLVVIFIGLVAMLFGLFVLYVSWCFGVI